MLELMFDAPMNVGKHVTSNFACAACHLASETWKIQISDWPK